MGNKPTKKELRSSFQADLTVTHQRAAHDMQALLREVKFIGTSKISDFEVLRVLGRGSNGVVVEAKCIDPQFPFPEKRYAIKMCLNYDKNTSEVTNIGSIRTP